MEGRLKRSGAESGQPANSRLEIWEGMRSDTTRETDTRNRMCGDWVVTTFRELKRRRRLGPMLARCPDRVQVCVELGWLALASPGTLLAQESYLPHCPGVAASRNLSLR